MLASGHLYGFEKDIHQLIDTFALQAHNHQQMSFQSFKQLFKEGNYACLHQAYSGCEHSPEYTQLLYATALDRLDSCSPTASSRSSLWRLHVDPGQWPPEPLPDPEATTAADAGRLLEAQQMHQQQKSTAQPSAGPSLQITAAAAAAPAALNGYSANVQGPNQQGLQQQQGLWQHYQEHHSLLQQQQQQQPAQVPQQGPIGEHGQHRQHAANANWSPVPQQQQLQQHLSVDQQAQQQLLKVQLHHALPPPRLQVPAIDESAPVPLRFPDDDLDDNFLDDLLAIFDEATAGPGPQAGQLQPPVGTTGTGNGSGTAGLGSNTCTQGNWAEEQQDVFTVREIQPLAQQLSIPAAAAAQAITPVISVPLVVKAAVVFMLHCIYETQLNLPKVCIYVPLQLIKQLNTAAAEFRAADPVATDALLVLLLLLSEHRILVGHFRRPVHYKPQLPAWLQPPKPTNMWGFAASAAASRAAARAAGSSVREAAVTAAARAVSSLSTKESNVDPVVHRDAIFHIKTALRSLSNFRSLQRLCNEYTLARRAIFEPLLGIKVSAAATGPVAAAETADEQQQQPSSRIKQGCLDGHANDSVTNPSDVPHGQQHSKRALVAAAASSIKEPPELFDSSFGAALQQLANDEATRMLELLDPGPEVNQGRKRQRRLTAGVTSSATGGALSQLRAIGNGGGNAGKGRRRQQGAKQQRKRGASSQGSVQQLSHVKDMCSAGIVQPAEPEDMEGLVEGSAVSGAAKRVLQLQAQRNQQTLQVAEEWFIAHDALMQQQQQQGWDDGNEDMP